MTFELGKKVRCKVTGFTGVAVGRTENMNGCMRYHVQPRVDEDGKYPEGLMIDETVLEYVEDAGSVAGEKGPVSVRGYGWAAHFIESAHPP